MPTILSKFAENDALFNDFLGNPKYSIQNKSWQVFNRLGIKDWVARQEIEGGDFKPWRDPERFGQWALKREYNIVTDKLSEEETKIEWLKLMDHWYRECFENDCVKIKRCHSWCNRCWNLLSTKGQLRIIRITLNLSLEQNNILDYSLLLIVIQHVELSLLIEICILVIKTGIYSSSCFWCLDRTSYYTINLRRR